MWEVFKRGLFFGQAERRETEFAEKLAGLEELLGPVYTEPNDAVDGTGYCFFTYGIPGTAIATYHLIQPPSNHVKWLRRSIPYEVVAFTRHSAVQAATEEDAAAFRAAVARIAYVLDVVGRYSTVDTLQPGSCCEMPARRENNAGYLVFSEYTRDGKRLTVAGRTYNLLLCIEVYADEFYYARLNGVAALLEKLQAAGYYPYSDMDRPCVV